MKKLTQKEMNIILDNAPKGTDKKGLVDKFVMRGYDVEGIDNESIRNRNKEIDTPVQTTEVGIEDKQEGNGTFSKLKNAGTQIVGQAIPGFSEARAVSSLVSGNEAENPEEGFQRGVLKGGLSTLKGLGELGTKLQQFIIGENFEPADIYVKGSEANLKAEAFLKAEGTAEQVGKFTEQVAEFAIPASKLGKVTKGANFLGRTVPKAISSAGVATAQEGEIGVETAIAGSAEILLPASGKIIGFVSKKANNVIKRILAGSGAPIEEITDNPKAIIDAMKNLKGKDKLELTNVLKENTKKIIEGINDVDNAAGKEFEQGIAGLKETTANVEGIKSSVDKILPKHGISIKNGKVNLNDAEFLTPSIRKRASGLIETLNNFKDTSGKGVRDMVKQIELKKFKNAGTDSDKLSFNAFANDLDKAFKGAVPELKEINRKFSGEKQLTDAIRGTLGKLKFKGNNLLEMQKASEKLKNLLQKSDLGAENVDKLLTKIGLTPSEFRAEEAVRRVVSEPFIAEKAGFSPFEIVRQITAGIIDPKDATKIAAKMTQVQQSNLVTTLQGLDQVGKSTLLKSLLDIFGGDN